MVGAGLLGGVGCALAVALVLGGLSGPAHADTTPAPESVTDLTASADDGDVVTLQWTPSSTADVISYVAGRRAARPRRPASPTASR